MRISLYTFILAGVLTGCGEPSQLPTPTTKLFESQREALDKSKQIQQTVNEQAEQQKQAVDQQSQ